MANKLFYSLLLTWLSFAIAQVSKPVILIPASKGILNPAISANPAIFHTHKITPAIKGVTGLNSAYIGQNAALNRKNNVAYMKSYDDFMIGLKGGLKRRFISKVDASAAKKRSNAGYQLGKKYSTIFAKGNHAQEQHMTNFYNAFSQTAAALRFQRQTGRSMFSNMQAIRRQAKNLRGGHYSRAYKYEMNGRRVPFSTTTKVLLTAGSVAGIAMALDFADSINDKTSDIVQDWDSNLNPNEAQTRAFSEWSSNS